METMTERYGVISIHSSHTGRDVILLQAAETSTKFQSTLPIREETIAREILDSMYVISIHSSHTGRDHAKQG